MEAQELRLKNLVYVNHKMDRLAYVDSISDYAIQCVFVDGMSEDMATGMIVSPSKLIPVPLTEDLLLRMGFEKTHRGKFERDDLPYDLYGGVGLYMHGVKPEIEHVHQLQNLYHALTGEELTIK